MNEEDNIVNSFKYNCTTGVNNVSHIVTTINKLPINDEIKDKAINNYYNIINDNKVGKLKSIKKGRKDGLVFYCVFEAYNELNKVIEPCYLAELLSMEKLNINKAFIEYIPHGVKLYKAENIIEFYVDRLNELCENDNLGLKINVSEIIQGTRELLTECRKSKVGDEWININTVRCVGISAIYFYITILMSIKLQRKYFEQVSKLSWTYIKKNVDKISSIYNNIEEDKNEIKLYYPF